MVPRTRDPFALSLLCRAQLDGVRTVNRWEAIQAVRDKPHAALLLARAGVPAPRTFLTDRPGLAGGLPAAAWPLLLKPPYGDNGDGIVRVDSPRDLERLPWPDGMVLAQHYVDVAGVDVKLYGAGTEVWAARGPRRCSRRDRGTSRCPCRSPKSCGVRSGLPRRLRAGAVRRGRAAVPGGPLVVDVNDFPNYTGIAEAPDAVADLVESRLAEVVPS